MRVIRGEIPAARLPPVGGGRDVCGSVLVGLDLVGERAQRPDERGVVLVRDICGELRYDVRAVVHELEADASGHPWVIGGGDLHAARHPRPPIVKQLASLNALSRSESDTTGRT